MADTNIPPALQLKELIESYPTLTPESPSSWFVWSDTPGTPPKSYSALICHADMRYTHTGYDHLVTAVPKNGKISLKYIRMLIHGPFRAFSDLISLVSTKDGYYLQCDELKKWPANVLFNFCIASRAPIEFGYQINGWEELLGQGYPEVLAFLLSHSMKGEKFNYGRRFPDHGHYWFDPSSDWRRIIDGTPDLTGLNYHDFPNAVTPTNAIWGKSQDFQVVQKLDNIKAAEYFGFKFPPKLEKTKINTIRPSGDMMWKHQWVDPGGQGANAEMVAAQNHMNQILQMNQAAGLPGNQVNGAWAPPAWDQPAVPEPVLHVQPPQHDNPNIVDLGEADDDAFNDWLGQIEDDDA